MNVLYLYNETQTYTNTVYEHIAAFRRYSVHTTYFCHQDQYREFNVDLERFDAVVIHYSVRLPYDQIAESTAHALGLYTGLKVLFIQDEYDHTCRAWYWIKRLGIQLVFTVVPDSGISRVYPPEEFPGVRFINNLTGYVPEEEEGTGEALPPSKRSLVIGYRGRPLPMRYGQLGQEKVAIGQLVQKYCEAKGIRSDIAWTEEKRIYGPKWYEFVRECRAMLGSESGSNVFDWDGTLAQKIKDYRCANPAADDIAVYEAVVRPHELPGLMNQVSPRIFEAIFARTILVLFEGTYSNVVVPGRHFIPLRKDGSNLDEVFALLENERFVDEMAERAYEEVIASGKYSYSTFVATVDRHLEEAVRNLIAPPARADNSPRKIEEGHPSPLTTSPVRAVLHSTVRNGVFWGVARLIWTRIPDGLRTKIKPGINVLLGRG